MWYVISNILIILAIVLIPSFVIAGFVNWWLDGNSMILDELLHKVLCKLSFHRWHFYYDTEHSLNGETEFCEYCEAQR
jgi:hypothetical protein